MPYINNFSKCSTVLGPGKRAVIWFQGCLKSCPNCINPSGKKLEAGRFYSCDELIDLLKKSVDEDDIIGVTISGGEPFVQYDELEVLVCRIKDELNLDIMLYSGYILDDLLSQKEEFFSKIDIFVDGDYVEDLDYGNLYRGSSNQKIYCFTEKYKKFLSLILETKQRDMEFEITKENDLFLVGIPPKGFYKQFLDKIENLEV